MPCAVYRKEKGSYGLRSKRRAREGEPVSGVVLVSDDAGRGLAYITFSEAFVEAVGRALPYGVSEEDPAYIKVVHHGKLGEWKVYAYYLSGTKGVLLWSTPDKPEWLKRIRRVEDGQSS